MATYQFANQQQNSDVVKGLVRLSQSKMTRYDWNLYGNVWPVGHTGYLVAH